MNKVSGPQVVTPAEAFESPLPAEFRRRSGRVGRGEGGAARRQRGRRADGRARVDGGRGRRDRRPEGQVEPGSDGQAPRHERGSMTWAAGGWRSAGPGSRTADDERELPVNT